MRYSSGKTVVYWFIAIEVILLVSFTQCDSCDKNIETAQDVPEKGEIQ